MSEKVQVRYLPEPEWPGKHETHTPEGISIKYDRPRKDIVIAEDGRCVDLGRALTDQEIRDLYPDLNPMPAPDPRAGAPDPDWGAAEAVRRWVAKLTGMSLDWDGVADLVRLACAQPPAAAPGVEGMAEALCRIDSKPHHITWEQMASRAEQGDVMCEHVMSSYRGRAVPLSAALSDIARLAPAARVGAGDTLHGLDVGGGEDRPIPEFHFTPDALLAKLRACVAEGDGLTVILPAAATRDMLAWAEGTADAGSVREAALRLSCDDQYALAARLAGNLGYDLTPEGETDPEPGQPVQIAYTNWRGEPTTPTILPTRVFWGSNEWHPEPCWLLEALDVGKGALRTFDLRKIRPLPAPPSPERGGDNA